MVYLVKKKVYNECGFFYSVVSYLCRAALSLILSDWYVFVCVHGLFRLLSVRPEWVGRGHTLGLKVKWGGTPSFWRNVEEEAWWLAGDGVIKGCDCENLPFPGPSKGHR